MKPLMLSEPLAVDAVSDAHVASFKELASFTSGFRLILSNEGRHYGSSIAITESMRLFYRMASKQSHFASAVARLKFEQKKHTGSHRSIVLNNTLLGMEVLHVSPDMPVMLGQKSDSYLLLAIDGDISVVCSRGFNAFDNERQLSISRNDGALLKSKPGLSYQIHAPRKSAMIFLVRLK